MSNNNLPSWLQSMLPTLLTTLVTVLVTMWIGKEILEARYDDLREIVKENRGIIEEIRSTRYTNKHAEKDQAIILTEIRMLQTQIDLLRSEIKK